MTGRRVAVGLLLLGAVSLLALAGGGSAQTSSFLVEDWTKIADGTRGIPPGWQGLKWGDPKYDFKVVTDDGVRALAMRSDKDSSTISKEVQIDAKALPVIEWRWKVVTLPPRGDARKADTDDEAAQIYVVFPRFPTAVRSRIIGYIWDSTAPAGSVFKSDKVGTVTFVVVRSGSADLGRWITETRNVYEDFRKIYGEAPTEKVGAVTLSINSQNTGARAEAFFGPILFKAP